MLSTIPLMWVTASMAHLPAGRGFESYTLQLSSSHMPSHVTTMCSRVSVMGNPNPYEYNTVLLAMTIATAENTFTDPDTTARAFIVSNISGSHMDARTCT